MKLVNPITKGRFRPYHSLKGLIAAVSMKQKCAEMVKNTQR